MEDHPKPVNPPMPTLPPTDSQNELLSFLSTHPFIKPTLIDKIHGCIIGSALGDAIGLYTEFLNKEISGKTYPGRKFSLVDPVTEWYQDHHRNKFDPCAWTDDTDHALLLLLAYLSSQNLTTLPQDFASRLSIWIEQGLLALGRPPCGIGRLVGGVVTRSDYLFDPVARATKEWVNAGRKVAPNGSLMRTHPIGVIGVGLHEEEAWRVAAGVGRTTHVDPRCTLACCISVGVIRGILRGEVNDENDLDALMERAFEWVCAQPNLANPDSDPDIVDLSGRLHREDFTRYVYANRFEDLELDDRDKIGYVYKCLGSAILALRLGMRATRNQQGALPPDSIFEDIMADLIMEGGDADTNGAAAGALLGAWLGYSQLPPHWKNGLKHRDWLANKIGRLIRAVGIEGSRALEFEEDEAPDGGRGLMTRSELEKRDQDMVYRLLEKDRLRREEEEKARKKEGRRIAGWLKR
ncbi:ADP-ribosylglycohydrolase [Westerdykella ornata]|uniref:ADP-ribosylglycohydrolase n=1 Tax=Westerdykella ornata TaxID=318751 RepID=A0A6A6JRM5_WESOR|nr:ADP-ribosylglycohydrolase [Westerdykella ornata]KAF2279271.1 ADP-ribosylglycohydrolase [Westerdykella ornata]